MIKYIEYDSIDEYGRHIIPINDNSLIKTAAFEGYAPELTKIIVNIKRNPNRYYVVINALGAYEVWGYNRNGDAFPESGLAHKSLRTDMGTPNDYGYKTFEYYAKLYKHHYNKQNAPSFGEVLYSNYNNKIKRVELIVGIDTIAGADIIQAIENQELVAVSMGCKIRYDICNICGNEAKTRKQYCKHLKYYLRRIVDEEMAARWSRETGRKILPGMAVFAWNYWPRFFDISRVHVGADRTSFILGKAASDGETISSVDIAEAYGVTDDMIDKIASLGKISTVKKLSDIKKEVGGAVSSDDIDGRVSSVNDSPLRKVIDNIMIKTIESEPRISNNILNNISEYAPLNNILSTMIGLGIHPKPTEFQRIVLICAKRPDVADYLEDRKITFNPNEQVEPADIDLSDKNFDDIIARILLPYLTHRSSFHPFLEKRMEDTIEKEAGVYDNVVNPKDYWLESGPGTGLFINASPVSGTVKTLGGLAAIYAGLKAFASARTSPEILTSAVRKPWINALIGGGILALILQQIMKGSQSGLSVLPARNYEGILQNTNFSGQLVKQSSKTNSLGMNVLTSGIVLPMAYSVNTYNQRPMYEQDKSII